jgi:hypothetical protein
MQFEPDDLEYLNKVFDPGTFLGYPLLCSAYTVEKMVMWMHTTEKVFETITFRGPGMPRKRIEGHLYRLTDEELKKLDDNRRNGVDFIRKSVPVYVPFKDADGNMKRVNAWMYLGEKSKWLPEIENNQGCTIIRGLQRIPEKSNFALANSYVDADRVLHNRYSLYPPLQEFVPTYDLTSVNRLCAKRNRGQLRTLWFDNMRRRLKSFVE